MTIFSRSATRSRGLGVFPRTINIPETTDDKKVNVEVEVVDRLPDYNILLGRPWVYAMAAIISTYFRTIAFPFKGGIIVIDQLAFFANSSQDMQRILLIHENSQ